MTIEKFDTFVLKDEYSASLSDFVSPLHNDHIKPCNPFRFTISNLLYSSKAALGTFNREQSKLMIRNLSSELARLIATYACPSANIFSSMLSVTCGNVKPWVL